MWTSAAPQARRKCAVSDAHVGASRLNEAHAAAAASPMPAHESKSIRCWIPLTSIIKEDVPSAWWSRRGDAHEKRRRDGLVPRVNGDCVHPRLRFRDALPGPRPRGVPVPAPRAALLVEEGRQTVFAVVELMVADDHGIGLHEVQELGFIL